MSKDKVAAYAQQQKRSLSPREVEAMAFTKAAVLLEEAKSKTGCTPSDLVGQIEVVE